jgi:stage II sporulation protein M
VGLWAGSLRQSWPAYMVVLAVFILGMTAGYFGVQNLQAEKAQELVRYLDSFLNQAGMIEVNTEKALSEVLFNDIIIILAFYILGLTVIGIPVVLGIIFARGFVLGFSVGFLILKKNIQGVVLACAAVLPQNVLFIPALLLGGVISLSFTILLTRRFFNSKLLIGPVFFAYSALMLMVTACAAGAGLIEVYLTPVLIKLAAGWVLN